LKSAKRSTIWPIIKSSKILRSLNLLIALLVVLIIVSVSIQLSFRSKYQMNQEEVLKNEQAYQNLQIIAQSNVQAFAEDDVFLKKSFADYEEVVPFIAFLESLFSVIDPKAEIIIKSKEEQIFIDHFADYTVQMDIKGAESILYKAFDELENSRFIMNLMNFEMGYKPIGDEGTNLLDRVEFTIRLFLK